MAKALQRNGRGWRSEAPLCATVVLFILSLLVMVPRASFAQEMQFSESKLVKSLLPKVVNVTAFVLADVPQPRMAGAAADIEQDRQTTQQRKQLGSGFVINPDGVIVTNFHVIQGAFRILITFFDGAQTEATLMAADRLSDIALLKVEPIKPLEAVKWGDSSTVEVGDPVIAIGNPFGVGLSVTGGIVSALNRDIMQTPVDDYIQTDAPINHGNSGGPLFNIRGEVIGINEAILTPNGGSTGLAFAIPSNDARFVIDQLRRYGMLRPGWLGVKLQQLTPEMTEALGIQAVEDPTEDWHPPGAIVAAVHPDGPAAKAGITVGDVVEQFNGYSPPDARALLRRIAECEPGTKVTIRIWRDGVEKNVSAVMAPWPRELWERNDPPVSATRVTLKFTPDLGLSLRPVTAADRQALGLKPDVTAVVVHAVTPNTPAAQLGLRPGDALLRLQQTPLAQPSDYLAALDAARERHHRYALLLVAPRNGSQSGPEWRAIKITP
ncbi:MAG: trypsin-like peptidase domain-containing protein [Acidobacteriia bacterium]|nr:trypsin-like peptidase domain-containing protein [Methyloceanibacter sp.]MCL6491808.1 trypsin-like peptidase domain-containing protein [Terriglobia bacterium]